MNYNFTTLRNPHTNGNKFIFKMSNLINIITNTVKLNY